jgi:hypothetical protein
VPTLIHCRCCIDGSTTIDFCRNEEYNSWARPLDLKDFVLFGSGFAASSSMEAVVVLVLLLDFSASTSFSWAWYIMYDILAMVAVVCKKKTRTSCTQQRKRREETRLFSLFMMSTKVCLCCSSYDDFGTRFLLRYSICCTPVLLE